MKTSDLQRCTSWAQRVRGVVGRGAGQDGKPKEVSRDQASSKADLISTSEVSDVLVLEGVLEVEVEVASNV